MEAKTLALLSVSITVVIITFIIWLLWRVFFRQPIAPETKAETKEEKSTDGFSPDNPNIKITAIVIAVIATVALATYATGKFLGTDNILKSGWCWIVFGALAVIFLINWIEKNIQIESAKKVCKAVTVVALLMLIVWTVWPDKTVKEVADGIRKKDSILQASLGPCLVKKPEKIVIREPGVYPFELLPLQSTTLIQIIGRELIYSFSSTTEKDNHSEPFFIRYKKRDVVKVDRPNVEIPDNAGPFRLTAGENGAKIKLLVFKRG